MPEFDGFVITDRAADFCAALEAGGGNVAEFCAALAQAGCTLAELRATVSGGVQ
jgi:hypothetical protein